jgi:hypothetical protein
VCRAHRGAGREALRDKESNCPGHFAPQSKQGCRAWREFRPRGLIAISLIPGYRNAYQSTATAPATTLAARFPAVPTAGSRLLSCPSDSQRKRPLPHGPEPPLLDPPPPFGVWCPCRVQGSAGPAWLTQVLRSASAEIQDALGTGATAAPRLQTRLGSRTVEAGYLMSRLRKIGRFESVTKQLLL